MKQVFGFRDATSDWRIRFPIMVLVALLAVLLLQQTGAGLTPRLVAALNPNHEAQERVSAAALQPLWETWEILQDGFVDRSALDPQHLGLGAIRGMLRTAPDLTSGDGSQTPATPIPRPGGAPAELSAVWDTWVWLFEAQGDRELPLEPPRLARGAILGLIQALDDPHTAYVPPERYQVEAKAFAGKYEGIGAQIYKRGGLFILSPMPDGPAMTAGIRAGDNLLRVDGASVAGWSVYDAVNRIRGPKSDAVVLEVLHLGSESPVAVEIIRGVIDMQSVFWSVNDENIAYLRLSAFYSNTDAALKSALNEILDQGALGLILDLRNNPGGFLSATVKATGYFVDEPLVTYAINAKGQRKDHKSKSDRLATDLPLVLLVNQFSASGSEVMVGALQDYGRARVVGTRTFGKGSVNLFKGLSDGGGLYYSASRWYTPKGRLIEGKGLEPDTVVVRSVTSQGDAQLQKALALVREQLS